MNRTTFGKIALAGISTAMTTLVVVGVYVWMNDGSESGSYYVAYDPPLQVEDELLGYGPPKSTEISATVYIDDERQYSVAYTIDENGLRLSPGVRPSGPDGCAVFFGGSFTFGQGLSDDQTMPFQVGDRGNYQVYNFGFNGYGPHQMLAVLEHGDIENVVSCGASSTAIYSSHVDHVQRSAGLAPWDRVGPRYVLASTGELRAAGHFDDEESNSVADASGEDEGLLEGLDQPFDADYPRLFSQANIDLYVGIVQASEAAFRLLYPEGRFHVLLWDERILDEYNRKVVDGLRRSGIAVHLVSEILPRFDEYRQIYTISDGMHPNAEANALVAEFVVENILQGQ